MGGKKIFDLVIRNGTVIDGTGNPGRVADVAVSEGRIVAVGEVTEPGDKKLMLRGYSCAGFVDVHTHFDAQVLGYHLVSVATTWRHDSDQRQLWLHYRTVRGRTR